MCYHQNGYHRNSGQCVYKIIVNNTVSAESWEIVQCVLLVFIAWLQCMFQGYKTHVKKWMLDEVDGKDKSFLLDHLEILAYYCELGGDFVENCQGLTSPLAWGNRKLPGATNFSVPVVLNVSWKKANTF